MRHLFFSLFEKFLACLPYSFFVTTAHNVNGKVSHDSILSSHWMKVRNRHKNGNFTLQKIVQSRHWISVSGTLPLFKKSKLTYYYIFKMNYSIAFKDFINSFQSTRLLFNYIIKQIFNNQIMTKKFEKHL